MYRFTSVTTGNEVAVSDTVNYIKKNEETETYILTSIIDEAQGVSINSQPYNIYGKEDIGGIDTVIISEFDGGAYAASQKAALDGMLASMLEG